MQYLVVVVRAGEKVQAQDFFSLSPLEIGKDWEMTSGQNRTQSGSAVYLQTYKLEAAGQLTFYI